MLRGWISSKKDHLKSSSSSTRSFDTKNEEHDLEEALKAASLIFNDDLHGAEEGLANGQSSFHKLGKGLVLVIRAALGFEADVMQAATELLAEAETSAAEDFKRAQRDHYSSSAIYEPGTEYKLTQAMSQLMTAVIAVFRESLGESVKGFFKLRTAYQTLQSIIAIEQAYLDRQGISKTSPNTPATTKFSRDFRSAPTTPVRSENSITGIEDRLKDAKIGDDVSDDEQFYDADEANDSKKSLDSYAGTIEVNGEIQHPLEKAQSLQPLSALDTSHLTSPTDEFIHSGTNLCFGMLSLLLSLIPPSFSRILSIVGFKGDRIRGLRMLWSSSRYPNVMGALAGLVLLTYHNGLIGAMDIITPTDPTLPLYEDENLSGYPAAQLSKLLTDMRTRFPHSKFWTIEQARMLSVQRDLNGSLAILQGDFNTPLKQVQALAVFERSLQAMYSHNYELCQSSFIECTERNNWSHALYFYTAGCAHVELYRLATAAGNQSEASTHATKATSLLKQAREKTGKRKFMARQLPFDAFVARKVNKWEARAATRNISLIDAIGISPIEELIFLWNGFRRMNKAQLDTSLERLAWFEQKHLAQPSASASSSASISKAVDNADEDGDVDERALLALLRAIVYQNLNRHEDAMLLLKEEILPIDKSLLKGGNREDWILPAANYEMGVCLWESVILTREEHKHGSDYTTADREKVRDAEGWLDKVAKWEAYTLDARLGMRVGFGLDTIRAWRGRHDT